MMKHTLGNLIKEILFIRNIEMKLSRVSDPHRFNADPDTDPDPAFHLITDPDPGFDDLKLEKMYN
jgi:hypothetical protein